MELPKALQPGQAGRTYVLARYFSRCALPENDEQCPLTLVRVITVTPYRLVRLREVSCPPAAGERSRICAIQRDAVEPGSSSGSPDLGLRPQARKDKFDQPAPKCGTIET
jgi:hypothetical protein